MDKEHAKINVIDSATSILWSKTDEREKEDEWPMYVHSNNQ